MAFKEDETIKVETTNLTQYGKFATADQLLDAYVSLEKEFTRKSQLLAKLLKHNVSQNSANTENSPFSPNSPNQPTADRVETQGKIAERVEIETQQQTADRVEPQQETAKEIETEGKETAKEVEKGVETVERSVANDLSPFSPNSPNQPTADRVETQQQTAKEIEAEAKETAKEVDKGVEKETGVETAGAIALRLLRSHPDVCDYIFQKYCLMLQQAQTPPLIDGSVAGNVGNTKGSFIRTPPPRPKSIAEASRLSGSILRYR